MRYIFITLFLLSFLGTVSAQDVDTVSSTLDELTEENPDEDVTVTEDITHTLVNPEDLSTTKQYKEEKIAVRKFDKSSWKKVIEETDFQEKSEERKPEPEEADKQADAPEKPSAPLSFAWLPYAGYAIILALVIFILYVVVKNTSFDFNKITKPIERENDLMGNIENIEELEIQSLLQQTLAAGNYRLALRMYFLDLLKALHETGKIAWKKDKTNREYLGELFSNDFQFNEIRKLTLAYEMVWYGEHTLPHESFRQLFSEFESIQSKLKNTSAQ